MVVTEDASSRLIFGTIAMFIWNSVPRLMSDLWHTREFVPAQNFTITNYECTNWNGFMFAALRHLARIRAWSDVTNARIPA
jgi:hypothetical protein